MHAHNTRDGFPSDPETTYRVGNVKMVEGGRNGEREREGERGERERDGGERRRGK